MIGTFGRLARLQIPRHARGRAEAAWVVTAVAIIMLAACGQELPTADAEFLSTLPDTNEVAPMGLPVGDWVPLDSFPAGFERDSTYPSATTVGESLGAILGQAHVEAGREPKITVRALDDPLTGQELVLLDELVEGVDPAAGSQYALFVMRDGEGWRLVRAYSRPVCLGNAVDGVCH